MKIRALLPGLVLALCPALGIPQTQRTPEKDSAVLVKAGKLLDVRTGSHISGAAIWIEGGRIKEVGAAAPVHGDAGSNVRVIDLGNATVLPGLIDCHTHLMARFDDSEHGYILGLATKSQAFRALEGAANARVTLLAGYTTVRDVENEGSGYADAALRDAIEQGLVEGPRMQVATRAIAAVGQYNPFGVSPDLTEFPMGAQMVSGAEEARRAVREQIGNGADLIKVYADWQHATLTVEEMRVVVEEAHKQGLKVAAHAIMPEGIKNALTAGVDSIEHGHGADHEALEMMKAKGVFLVPAVGAIDRMVQRRKADQLTPEQQKRLDAFVRGSEQEFSASDGAWHQDRFRV
jgi:imidazolonepropionase-like amidohydrolase